MYYCENRKKIAIYMILYTAICAAVMILAVFFQYRAYTKNYYPMYFYAEQILHQADKTDNRVS